MKIGIVTTTRAEYGLLKGLISKVQNDPESELCLIVTGTHLLEEFGNTVKFIEEDGFPIAKRVDVEICTEDSASISKTMGNYFNKFAGVFEELHPDILVVLGDRYELIPICFCAINAKIPIAHISGGEVTTGAIDDIVRHCVTKASLLHFPACEDYRKRIIQLGEDPNRVFNVGDPGVENIRKLELLSREDICKRVSIDTNKPYFVLVFHPITLDIRSPEDQVKEVISAIDEFPSYQFVILKSNADSGGERINNALKEYIATHNNCCILPSLKIEEFLALQKYSCGLIGNSSSGIVETPCFGIPTINIGDRQKGRLMADSIIDCPVEKDEIIKAVSMSLTVEFKEKAKATINPYGSGETSENILKNIKSYFKSTDNLIVKDFYDLPFNFGE